jgi:hypothetical protein
MYGFQSAILIYRFACLEVIACIRAHKVLCNRFTPFSNLTNVRYYDTFSTFMSKRGYRAQKTPVNLTEIFY